MTKVTNTGMMKLEKSRKESGEDEKCSVRDRVIPYGEFLSCVQK